MTTERITIRSLAAGGEGVATLADGRVCFVARTAPGDDVTVQVSKAKKRWARADVVRMEQPGSARVAVSCGAYNNGCGGCDWLHVARPAQLEAKQAIVAHALRDFVARGMKVQPISAPAPDLRWRRRARFHVSAGVVGLRALGTHRIVPVDACPQLDVRLDAALREIAKASPPDGELAMLVGQDGRVIVAVEGEWDGAAALIGRAHIVGVRAGKKKWGEAQVAVDAGLAARATDFVQASALGNAELVRVVLAAAGPTPGAVLELYAGGGNFTRGLAAVAKSVVAVDQTVSQLSAPNLTTHAVDATAFVPSAPIADFDLVLVDPPRTGLGHVAAQLAAAKRLIYVSCDPATLARDLTILTGAGLSAAWAQPLDLMPQTSHVETVVLLTRA